MSDFWPSPPPGNNAFGSAKLLAAQSGQRISDLAGGLNGVILGYKSLPMTSTKEWRWDTKLVMTTDISSNLVTIAPNRSGKGASVIIPNLLLSTYGMVVIDPKGENAWVTAKRRQALGQKVHILDPFNEIERVYGNDARAKNAGLKSLPVATLNPLSKLDPKSEHFSDDVDILAEALIFYSGQGDPHWADSARQLVSGLIAEAIERLGTKATLTDVRFALTQPPDRLSALIKSAYDRNSDPQSFANRRLARFANPGDNREIAGILSSAVTQTAFLDSPAIQNSFDTSSFDIADFAKGNSTVYLVLPADKLETHNRWLRIMLSSFITALTRRTERQRVVLMIDEFGTIGYLKAIESAYGLFAGYGISCWAFLQDLSQLQRDYPQSWQNILANAEVQQVFSIGVFDTAQYFSQTLGQETIPQPVVGEPVGAPQRFMGRDLMSPQEITALEKPRQLIWFKGLPHMGARLEYFSEPTLAAMAQPLPQFIDQPAPPPPAPPGPNWKLIGIIAFIGVAVILYFVGFNRGYEKSVTRAQNERAMTLDVPTFDGTLADNRRVNLRGNLWYVPEDGLPNISNNAMDFAINAAQACARGELTALNSLRDVGSARFNEAVGACTNQKANMRYKVRVTEVRLQLDR